jgi:hypothetical protein
VPVRILNSIGFQSEALEKNYRESCEGDKHAKPVIEALLTSLVSGVKFEAESV